jgi:hypothetical protein
MPICLQNQVLHPKGGGAFELQAEDEASAGDLIIFLRDEVGMQVSRHDRFVWYKIVIPTRYSVNTEQIPTLLSRQNRGVEAHNWEYAHFHYTTEGEGPDSGYLSLTLGVGLTPEQDQLLPGNCISSGTGYYLSYVVSRVEMVPTVTPYPQLP